MDILNFWGAVMIIVAGLAALALSVPAAKKKEYTLMNLGFFFTLYGLTWLIESPGVDQAVRSVAPRAMPWLHSFLTALIPIPFSAYLVNVFGKGFFSSMRWLYYSTIAYAAFAIAYDLFTPGELLSPTINTVVLAFWCVLGGLNVILVQDRPGSGITVLKVTLYLFFLSLAYDNLIIMGALSWTFRLGHFNILVLFTGMVYIALRRIRSSMNSEIHQ